jgi:hypothetical protein
MNFRRTAALAALMIAAAAPYAAAEPAGFAFLEVPAGARASALGGAYTSLAQGVDAAFWNPAGLESMRGIQVTAAHFEHLEALRMDQFAIGGHLFGGGMAASIRALYSEPIEERDVNGNLLGTFGAHDLEFGLSYGRAMREGLQVGASAQLVRERIADVAATTWSLGAGMSVETPALFETRWSLAAQNLGPNARFSQGGVKGDPVPLPAAVQAGVSRRFGFGADYGLSLAVEGRFTRGRSGVGMVGVELGTPLGVAVRSGLRVNDEVSRFAAGAGWAMGALRLDYAWVPYQLDLGDTHRFGLSAQF